MTQSRMYESSNHTMEAISSFSNVNPFTISQVRPRPSSKNSGNCLENHTGSHLENDDKAEPSKMVGSSNRQCLLNLNGKIRKIHKRNSYCSVMNELLESCVLNASHASVYLFALFVSFLIQCLNDRCLKWTSQNSTSNSFSRQ